MTTDPAPVFDFEAFLKSDELASMYNVTKRQAAIARTTGSLSTVASICMIVHILRSHHGLSTTYHRLVFGLAIGDILFSFFAFVLGDIMAPKEYGYIASGAMGNQATCDAQGFLLTFGSGIGLSYNMSNCIYYLAIVTFNKKDNYIRTKLEPWLHGISILIPLAGCSAVFAFNGYNSGGGGCGGGTNSVLPHCWGLESGEIRDGFTIPYGRGDGKEHPTLNRFLFILALSTAFATPVVIVVTMALMYRTVLKADKKMQKYGVGALRLRKNATNNCLENNMNGGNIRTSRNINPRGSSPAPPQDENSSGDHNDRFSSLIQWLKANCTKIPCLNSCCGREREGMRATAIASQKRAVLRRAVGYVTAWGLSYIPFFLGYLTGATVGMVIWYIAAILTPLQGVFNFIVYMLPKVRNAKNGPTKRSRMKHGGAGNGNHANAITWRQAFLKAYLSRGPKKTSGRHQHARTNGSSNGSWRSNILKVLKILRTSIIGALSTRQPMKKNSNDGEVNMNEPQEIRRPPVPGSVQGENMILIAHAPRSPPAQNINDCESPVPTLERNVYAGSPPLVLSEDADDLKEESEGESEEHHLNNNDDNESMNNEEMGDALDRVYLSEEIQSILE